MRWVRCFLFRFSYHINSLHLYYKLNTAYLVFTFDIEDRVCLDREDLNVQTFKIQKID